MSDWDLMLDEMERRVDLAERFLAGEDVVISEFERPHQLGPLPPAYAARAKRIHEATIAVEQRMVEQLERLALSASRVEAVGTYVADRPEPVFFDRSA